jgi:diaminohydroxyphosphoribosylaminopyrimidine deaminase/5-amino-6-(5-phosphoribosylamino)uracil reductase
MTSSDQDRRTMAAALRLGRRGLGRTWPNPSVACLLVRDGGAGPRIVGRGVTAPGGRPHAETQALAEAGGLARGATAYVTLEPCSHIGRTGPCAVALAEAGVARVVCAMRDPDPRVAGRGFALLREAGIEVVEDVLVEQAARDHAGHVARVVFGRPCVTLKLALSADGKVGRAGERLLITGETANARVHMMRAMSDAVLIGVGTALADDPQLTVRLPGLEDRSPIRVVLDAELRLPPSSRLVATAREVPTRVVASWGAPPERAEALEALGVAIHRVTPPLVGPAGVNPVIALRELVKIGITRVLAEGGPTLAASLLAHDLVDEIVLFRGPDAAGDDAIAAPAALGDGIARGDFALDDEAPIGRDSMTTYLRRR